MTETLKAIANRVAHMLMAPFRRHKRKRYATADDNTPRLELPNDKFLPLVREAVAGGEKAVISVKGFSMRPFLEHLRDKVELAPWTQLHVGDAVLAEIAPGHYVLHRIIAIEGQHLTLMGDGNIRGTERCRMDDVCGVVDAYIRPNGHVMLASDPKLQRRIRLWRRLLPLRRYLLFIYKHSI